MPLTRVRVVQSGKNAQPATGTGVDARFGQGMVLEGYTVRAIEARAGGELTVDLLWRAEAAAAESVVVFVHLLGETYNPATAGPVWAGHDSPPAMGGCPVVLWRPGDSIVDRHILAIDPAAPSGRYRVEVGVYRAADGERLSWSSADDTDGGDHLILEAEVGLDP